MTETQIERARQLWPGKVFAFVGVPARGPNPYALAVAVLGEAGYSGAPYREGFATYDEVADRADALNKALGYEGDTATVIVADTMHRSRIDQDRRAGVVTLRLSPMEAEDLLEHLEAEDYDDMIVDLLRDNLDESAKERAA